MNLRRLPIILTLSVALLSTVAVQARDITVFSDGSLLELEATARKGLVELALPLPIREGTLRVKPLDGGVIGRVELLPARLPDKLRSELERLTEQKYRLEDRLKALETREEIFAAAARSQSSKTPRKTKTNPDPLSSVRQGTEYAIAQLEAVFTARRRAEQELKQVSSRIETLRKQGQSGPTVRVTLSAPGSRVRVAALLQEGGWKPSYELRLEGGSEARLVQLAEADEPPYGFSARVTARSLHDIPQAQSFPTAPGKPSALAQWRLPIVQQQINSSPLPKVTVVLKNSSGKTLPGGPVTIYSQGEFLGISNVPSVQPDASFTVTNQKP